MNGSGDEEDLDEQEMEAALREATKNSKTNLNASKKKAALTGVQLKQNTRVRVQIKSEDSAQTSSTKTGKIIGVDGEKYWILFGDGVKVSSAVTSFRSSW